MILTLTFFVLSIVGIFALVSHKLFEMKGVTTKLVSWREKSDAIHENVIDAVKTHLDVIEKGSVKTLAKVFLASFLGAVLHGKNKVKEMWSNFSHFVDANSVLKNRGQASFYLKDISRHKENI